MGKYLMGAACLTVFCSFSFSAAAATAPFTVTLSFPTVSAHVGQRVEADVVVKNTSTGIVVLHRRNPVCDYDFTVTDASGKSINTLQNCSVGSEIGRNIIESLKPGESYTEHLRLDELLDVSQPGTYSVQVKRHIPKEFGAGAVASNILPFTREAN